MDEYSLLDVVAPPVGAKKKKSRSHKSNGGSDAGAKKRKRHMGGLSDNHTQRSDEESPLLQHSDSVRGERGAMMGEGSGVRAGMGSGEGRALGNDRGNTERMNDPIGSLSPRDYSSHTSNGNCSREANNELTNMLQMGLGLPMEHKDDQEQLLMSSSFPQLSGIPVSNAPSSSDHVLQVTLNPSNPAPKPPRRSNNPTASWHRRAPISTGQFTKAEDEVLTMAVDAFCQRKGMSPEVGRPRLLSGTYDQTFRNAWLEIGASLPERTIESLYYRARRLLAPLKVGAWTPEEVMELKLLHAEHGPKWSLIGQKLDRSGTSVRDKFRELRPTKKGKWSKEETDRLQELIVQHKQNDHIPWTTIARQMETRHHNQCRKKWMMAVKTINNSSVFALSQDRGLVSALIQQNVLAVNDVDWLTASIGLPWTSEQCKLRWELLSSNLVEETFSRQLISVAQSLDAKLRHRTARSDSDFSVKVSHPHPPMGSELDPVSVPLPVSGNDDLGLGRKRERSLDLVTPLPNGGGDMNVSSLLPPDSKKRRTHHSHNGHEQGSSAGRLERGGLDFAIDSDPDDDMTLL